jgi:DNA polymerase I-like protein with 3'-5' exonuclease and polymerase domains
MPRLSDEDKARRKAARELRNRDKRIAAASRKGYARAKKLAEVQNKIRRNLEEAEGPKLSLPAVVLRDGTVFSVPLSEAVKAISPYFDAMCLDVETSGYWIGHKHYELRTIQLGGKNAAVVLDALDPAQLQFASRVLKASSKLHAHSASADIIPCVHAGLIPWDEAWSKMTDSVLLAKLSDPKMSGSDANGLKDLAHDMLGKAALAPSAEKAKNALFRAMGCLVNTEVTTPVEKNGWYRVNRFSETMIRYAGSDVLDLGAVVEKLDPLLPVSREVLDRERAVQAICARVAYDGFKLDSAHIKAKIREFEAERDRMLEQVQILSSGSITNPSSPDAGEKMLAMDPELGSVLELSEKTGRPSAAKASLEKIKEGSTANPLTFPLAKSILNYRHDVTTLGLLLRPLENLCDYGDARMRPIVFTINADTGRMSCVRPNGQQFSRQGGIRASVVADAGYVRVNADFSGCEIRVAAALSGDRALLEAETSSKCWRCVSDPCQCEGMKPAAGLHWMAAIAAFSKAAVKEHRYWCKRIIFSKLFGGSAAAGARQVGIPVQESKKIHDAFETLAPVYAAWDKWLRKCFDRKMRVFRDPSTGISYARPIEGTAGNPEYIEMFNPALVESDMEAWDGESPFLMGRRYGADGLGDPAVWSHLEPPVERRWNPSAKNKDGSVGRMEVVGRGIYTTFNGRDIYVTAAHAFGNYAIQGTARELLAEALVAFDKVQREHPEWGVTAILPVHDELLMFCREEYFDIVTRHLHEAMATRVLSTSDWEVFVDADPELEPASFWEDSS